MSNQRVLLDDYYLNIALAVAARSHCLKKKYGAVIVNNNEIISTGYNGCPRGETHCVSCTKIPGNGTEIEYLSCPAVHAEQNAIISAARSEMINSTLYLAGINKTGEIISAEPCEICLRLIKNAGICKVINKSGILYERNIDGLLMKTKE